ncbi:13311_t:CDS:10 [Acaulospora colombiana]|uniref:13311_t:CDS:1 n=1 Tax=Acaulospora colombiana TaxID=27376 RepID=A0ACA9JZD2_9GLOM|nr:13311_t:CDS:10 [Acaulospora colombiana]
MSTFREEIVIDIDHETVNLHPDSIKEYHEKKDHLSLKKALQTAITATTKYDVSASIFAPSTSLTPVERWFYKLIPPLRNLAVKNHFGNFVIERETREKVWEMMPVYARIGMHLLFFGRVEEKVVEASVIRELFEIESERQGKYFDSPHSVRNIPGFIKHYNLNTEELLEPDISKYETFNEFFYRKLKPGARIISEPENGNVIVSAADSRLMVFRDIDLATKYWIKGKHFTVAELLKDEELAREFDEGSIAIFRLAPQDYHRFHSPITGVVGSVKFVSGTYFTVNPMAINEELDVFTENVRSVVALHPSAPGASKVVFVSIGALLVGSIRYTVKEGDKVSKGDELGYFAYGGSTIICLWQKGKVKFDDDLASNSLQSLETLVRGPLARVWLAAHWERKLSKTQFLQTNIQFSVGAILKQDQQPMALRLSGQLLLGVVRIYSRKAKYLLEDCTEALNKIKLAFRQGEVDIPEDQRIANFESITLPDKITEFDILLPDPGLSLKQWTEVSSVTATSSNISRPQDITIRDDFDISLNLNIGEDLLGEAFDTEDGRGLDLDLEDDLDPKATGSDDSHAGEEGSVDIEIAREAPLDIPISMEDVIGKGMEDDPLMMTDGGPDLDLLLDETLDSPVVDNDVPMLDNDVPTLEDDVPMLDNDVPVLDNGVPTLERESEIRAEIESSFDNGLNLDTNASADMNIDPASLILSETRVQEEMLPETQRLTPMSPLSPERHDIFQDQEVEQFVTRRKRKLMEDELTELPNSHIASQIRDRSDITIEPTFLPSSRKLLRIEEIRRMGASYYLDLDAPHNIAPEFQHLFARKRQRITPPPEEQVEAGPSKSTPPADQEHFEINIGNDNFDILDTTETHNSSIADEGSTQDVVITGEVDQEVPEKADRGKHSKKTDKEKSQEKSVKEKTAQEDFPVPEQEPVTPREQTPEHVIDINLDTISHHGYDDSVDALTPADDEDQSSPSGITIFDQEESQEQNAETTFSKNTIKAMRLLRNRCRDEDTEGPGALRTKIVSYDSVVGTAKRQDAVKLFFELLVLNTKDVIHVQQKQPYGDIEILCKNKLFDLLEDVPA